MDINLLIECMLCNMNVQVLAQVWTASLSMGTVGVIVRHKISGNVRFINQRNGYTKGSKSFRHLVAESDKRVLRNLTNDQLLDEYVQKPAGYRTNLCELIRHRLHIRRALPYLMYIDICDGIWPIMYRKDQYIIHKLHNIIESRNDIGVLGKMLYCYPRILYKFPNTQFLITQLTQFEKDLSGSSPLVNVPRSTSIKLRIIHDILWR